MARSIEHSIGARPIGSPQGKAAIEYALIAALILIAIVVAVGGGVDHLAALWDSGSGRLATILN